MTEGPMVPWELDCQHPRNCAAPKCECPPMKIKEIMEVPSEDYLKAVERWFEFWPLDKLTPDFMEFIGTDHAPIRRDNNGVVTVFVPAKGARRIKLLAGPYHHAILRAYAMRKQDD